MPLVILDCKIAGTPPKGLGRKMGAIYKASVRGVAVLWHDTILQGHFTPGNDNRYAFENRNPVYLQDIKSKEGVGQGRYVKDLLKGMSQRWLRTFFSVSGTSKSATVSMTAPTYFTNPFIGTFTDPQSGRLKHVTRQPDKPSEVTQVNENDRAALRRYAQNDVRLRVEQALHLRQQGFK